MLNNYVKFNLKKRTFKNEKEEDEKNQLLYEKMRISHFYWNENLNLSQFQWLKNFSKIFLGSTVMTKLLGPKVGKKQNLPLNRYL